MHKIIYIRKDDFLLHTCTLYISAVDHAVVTMTGYSSEYQTQRGQLHILASI